MHCRPRFLTLNLLAACYVALISGLAVVSNTASAQTPSYDLSSLPINFVVESETSEGPRLFRFMAVTAGDEYVFENGAAGEIRTLDLSLTKGVLYP